MAQATSIEKQLSEEAIKFIRRNPDWKQVIMMIGGSIAISTGISLTIVDFHSQSQHDNSVGKEEIAFIRDSVSNALAEIREIRSLLISILRERGDLKPETHKHKMFMPFNWRDFKFTPPIGTAVKEHSKNDTY